MSVECITTFRKLQLRLSKHREGGPYLPSPKTMYVLVSPASPENAINVDLFNALVLSSAALMMVGPRICALEAAIKVKSLPVIPRSTSLRDRWLVSLLLLHLQICFEFEKTYMMGKCARLLLVMETCSTRGLALFW